MFRPPESSFFLADDAIVGIGTEPEIKNGFDAHPHVFEARRSVNLSKQRPMVDQRSQAIEKFADASVINIIG
jgi:hypothetical protein